MSQPTNENPQFFLNPYPSAPCDMFNCLNRAKWLIGRPSTSGALVMPGFLRICESCAKEIAGTIPEELLSHLPKHPDAKHIGNQNVFHVTDNLIKEFLFVLESGDPGYCADVALKFKDIIGAKDPVAEVKRTRKRREAI